MPRQSPLLDLHRSAGALLAPYGPDTESDSAPLLVEAFTPVPIEYAAIRTHAAAFDQPHRATLIVTGPDRLSFLNRMVTQELDPKGKEPGAGFALMTVRRSFWLNRKGRIDADLRLFDTGVETYIDVDIHAAQRTLQGLGNYIITEDCAIQDVSARFHRIALHGPAAASRLAEAAGDATLADIRPDQVRRALIAGAEALIDRDDLTGEIGLNLLIPAENVRAVYERLIGADPARPTPPMVRPTGWHAVNIARIEAGSPLYYVDFGPNSLPHEAGEEVLRDRVSFKKGCYLGQEVVARMQSLGHPKQRLVALRMPGATGRSRPGSNSLSTDQAQAITGTPVLPSDAPDAQPVGAVTSSCISPMLGDVPIAFAMVKWANSDPDTDLMLDLGNARVAARVQSTLKFWTRG